MNYKFKSHFHDINTITNVPVHTFMQAQGQGER